MYTLITGTTSGIGKEFAELFAKKGYNLVTVAMNEEKLKEQKQTLESKYNISVKYIVKDLSIEESYSEIYNEVKASNIEIDILINNAGFATYGNYIDVEWQKQKNLAMVNMMAVMQLSYMFGKDMAKRKSGRIMNIASIASFEPGPFMTMYYASKAFVRSFSEGLLQSAMHSLPARRPPGESALHRPRIPGSARSAESEWYRTGGAASSSSRRSLQA